MKRKVIILSIILFILDQTSKVILDRILLLGKSITVFTNFFYITKVYNTGISFSMLTGKRILIIIINLLVLVLLYFYMKKFKVNKRNTFAFSFVFGGLLGNLLDRIIYGYVIDFLDFYIIGYNYPIFNLADTFIVIGISLLLYSIYLGEDNEKSRR